MNLFHWIAGSVLAVAWFSRIVDAALGMPKIADVSRPEWDRKPASGKGNSRVSIIVPARNEEEHIAETLRLLLALDYDNYEVIAVDDRSTDRTGELMDQMAGTPQAHGCLKVLHVAALPSGWLGKTHAMWTSGKLATGDWLLFTDADVLFKPDSLRRALAYAQQERADHVVVFPRMIMKRPGEKMMIAFFQTLFVFGHRPWKVADPETRDHMGVGAFNCIRRSVYEAIGTYQALRMEVLDDMKLGKVVKNAGYRQRNVFGGDLISIRWAKGAILCHYVVPVVAHCGFKYHFNFSESRSIRGDLVCSGLGTRAVCGGFGFDVRDLCRHVAAFGGAAILLLLASHQHSVLCLYTAALYGSDLME